MNEGMRDTQQARKSVPSKQFSIEYTTHVCDATERD